MVQVIFRITHKYIKVENIVEYLKTLGNNLFLVEHQKENNYHYHGYLDTFKCVKTYRTQLKELLNEVEIPYGFRPITISEKVNDVDRYKSYCLYRPGHPIEPIYVEDDLEKLKEIHEGIKKNPDKQRKELQQERELREVLEIAQQDGLYKTTREIARIVVNYYKETGRVIHVAKMQQLIWTVKVHQGDEENLIDRLVVYEDFINDEKSFKINVRRIDEKTADAVSRERDLRDGR